LSWPNRAFEAFLANFRHQIVWAEVLVERSEQFFLLRHTADREFSPDRLRNITVAEVRDLANFTENREFRPLKSAPTLRRGWILTCRSPAELWRVLQDLYPGSIPDWFATQNASPPVTHYREFTNRQSGMYRITQMLSNEEVAEVIHSTCSAQSCLKRRLWTIEGFEIDSSESKSLIPCLEPCAILLENARKAMRAAQEHTRISENS
jgi:hypothetical protein